MSKKEKCLAHDLVLRAVVTASGEVKDQYVDVLNFMKISIDDLKEK